MVRIGTGLFESGREAGRSRYSMRRSGFPDVLMEACLTERSGG
jgi:hypothetical protein